MLDQARFIVGRLARAGHEAFYVGGAVRDIVLGRDFKEIDITTNARPSLVKELFSRTVAIGEAFGVVCVLRGGRQFEVATYRREGSYSDGRHPDSVKPGTLEQDVERRDFTVNGLVLDPECETVLDLVGGLDDLRQGIIRAIGNAAERMEEDFLRCLRAVRFSATLGFEVEAHTLAAVRSSAPGLARISRERVHAELEKMCASGVAAKGLSLLHQAGLSDYVFPVLVPFGDEQVSLAEALLGGVGVPVGLPELLASLHLAVDDSWWSEPPAQARRERVVALQARDLRLSVADRRLLSSLLGAVGTLHDFAQLRLARRADLYRAECFETVVSLLRILLTRSGQETAFLDEALREKAELPSDRLHPPRLVTGDDLLRLGFVPGPLFKELLQETRDLYVEGALKSREEALAHLAGLAPTS